VIAVEWRVGMRGALVATLMAASSTLAFATPAHADDADRCADQAETAPLLREKGRWLEARSLYERCAADACPRVVRTDCREALADLNRTIPKLSVRVRDDGGRDRIEARVEIDGVRVGPDERARGVEVDPGRHVVRARLDGSEAAQRLEPSEQVVVVDPADHLRVVEVVLTTPAAAATAAPAAMPPARAVAPQRNRTAAVIVGSIGLTLLAGFTALGSSTYADYSHLQGTCGHACNRADVDSLRTRAAIADSLLGAGLVTLVVATLLWLYAPERHGASAYRPPLPARW
jgi:hypothetical protein